MAASAPAASTSSAFWGACETVEAQAEQKASVSVGEKGDTAISHSRYCDELVLGRPFLPHRLGCTYDLLGHRRSPPLLAWR